MFGAKFAPTFTQQFHSLTSTGPKLSVTTGTKPQEVPVNDVTE